MTTYNVNKRHWCLVEPDVLTLLIIKTTTEHDSMAVPYILMMMMIMSTGGNYVSELRPPTSLLFIPR
jgi:hypothetical protein